MKPHAEFITPEGEIQTRDLMQAYDLLYGEVGQLQEEIEVLEYKLKQSSRNELTLRRQLTAQNNEGKRAAEVKEVIEYWVQERAKLPGTRKLKIDMDGKHADKVRARLNQSPDPWTVEDLKRAVDGAMCRPYTGPQFRTAEKHPGAKLNVDLELICRESDNVARFIRYAEEAQPKAPPRLVLVPNEEQVSPEVKARMGLPNWPDTLGGGRERRVELSDTLRLIAVTLKRWERREQEAA
jgi:hypothetical protein